MADEENKESDYKSPSVAEIIESSELAREINELLVGKSNVVAATAFGLVVGIQAPSSADIEATTQHMFMSAHRAFTAKAVLEKIGIKSDRFGIMEGSVQ